MCCVLLTKSNQRMASFEKFVLLTYPLVGTIAMVFSLMCQALNTAMQAKAIVI